MAAGWGAARRDDAERWRAFLEEIQRQRIAAGKCPCGCGGPY